jgi:predicted alpha/beta hydrolase
MGVVQAFYAGLGAWLAGQGFLAITFDYRGMGRSRRGPLREEPADLVTWGRLDSSAALAAAVARVGGRPVTWLGHSLGGQLLPWVDGLDRVARVVTVATGGGYWRETTPWLRPRAWFLFFVAVPALMPVFGYFPGRRLRMVGDVPRGAMAQWRRWCLDRDYAAGAEGLAVRAAYAAVRVPITSLSFTDDEMMSARNVEAIHGQYTGSVVTKVRLSPAEVGVERIGHFGCLRPAMAGPLWERHLLPLLAG